MTDFLDRDQENNTVVKLHTLTTKRLHVLVLSTKDYLIRWVKNRTLVIWTIRLSIVSNLYLSTTALYSLTQGKDIRWYFVNYLASTVLWECQQRNYNRCLQKYLMVSNLVPPHFKITQYLWSNVKKQTVLFGNHSN